tara:strand:- start:5937 stop:7076 length:1140 start_codon:yes stop_codon:yes gene_type:complete
MNIVKTAHAVEKRRNSLLDQIIRRRHLDNSIDRAALVGARNRYLYSLDVKLAHLQRLQPNELNRQTLYNSAKKLNPFAPHLKPIRFQEIPRAGRQPRRVVTLPMRLKASHRMAKDLIEAQLTPDRSVYGVRGRGRDVLVNELLSRLKATPDRWVVIGDIRNCYDSIRPDAIYRLNYLPEAFVEAALDVRQMHFRQTDHIQPIYGQPRSGSCNTKTLLPNTNEEQSGLCGLIQGSPASNALLSVFFNDLHSQMPSGVVPFVISDNIILVCSTAEQCSMAYDALGDYFSRHHAGPLALEIEFAGDARDGFSFLGYTIEWLDDHWAVRHSSKNLIKAVKRLCMDCEDPDLTADDALATLLNGFGSVDAQSIGNFISIIDEAI